MKTGYFLALVFLFVVLITTIVSAETLYISNPDEINLDDSRLRVVENGNQFELIAIRMSDNIISAANLRINLNDESYFGDVGAGNIKKEHVCMGGPNCLQYEDSLFFSSSIILFGGVGNQNKITGIIAGELYDIKKISEPDRYVCEGSCLITLTYNEETNVDLETYNQRISALESWEQTIEDWKYSVTQTITDIWDAIANIGEDNGNDGNITSKIYKYIKYLSNSDKKKMLCGYGEELEMQTITDLGMSCNLTYSTSTSNLTRVSCKCK